WDRRRRMAGKHMVSFSGHLPLDSRTGGRIASPAMRTVFFRPTAAGIFLALALFTNSLCAANWPAWRGPQGTGVCPETNLPIHWSTNENVRWRTPLIERGNSTPVIWGKRVFITQAISKENRRTLICFD